MKYFGTFLTAGLKALYRGVQHHYLHYIAVETVTGRHEITCLTLCGRSTSDLGMEPASFEPTFLATEYYSWLSAVVRSHGNGCCFLVA